MYSLIPFILIISTNILLIYEIKKQTASIKSATKDAKSRAMNRLVILLALLFIVLTLPGAVVTSILNKVLQERGIVGFVIINICDCLSFSFHALNFLIVMLTNKRFAYEVKAYFKTKFNLNQSSKSKTNKTSVNRLTTQVK